MQRLCDNIKDLTCMLIGIPGEQRKNGTEEIFEKQMAKSFPNIRYYTTNQSISKNPKQD